MPLSGRRTNVYLPPGLSDRVRAILGKHGLSGLITTLLLRWLKENEGEKK